MSSLNKVLRAMNKSAKKSKRNSERRRRELVKMEKERSKMMELDRANYEYEVYLNRIDVIQSVHMETIETINWHRLVTMDRPFPENEKGPNEKRAQINLDNYSPGFIDKIFKQKEAKKNLLSLEVEKAVQIDKELIDEWKENTEVASKVLEGDSETWIQVIQEQNPFDDILQLGVSLNISASDSKLLRINAMVQADVVVPNQEKSLTKTGKLSVKNMNKTKYFELYQDFVCSVTLRIARDVFAVLPTNKVVVNISDKKLDSSTGHNEEILVFSGVFPKEVLNGVNLSMIDPSDSMINFKHNMKFLKTSGLQKVELVEE